MDFQVDFNYFNDRPRDVQAEHRRRVNFQVNLMFRIRTLNDPFAVTITEFRKTYRLPQHLVIELCQLIAPFMGDQHNHVRYIPLEVQVLCALAFYAFGSYQKMVGKMTDISVCQASVSNAMSEVTAALNHDDVLSRYIRFPKTREERAFIITRNERLGMPRVLGFIDGSLIKIVPQPRNLAMESYFCRKGYTALNVQLVCDADLDILDINARFPGSCNDPYIYDQSGIRRVVRAAYAQDRCWLLGDSIYPLEPWMHMPMPHAERGTPEFEYTELHCHCRNCAERCIGVFKNRWRCCLHGRTLHYRPVKAGRIINACAFLHNFCILHNLDNPRYEDEPDVPDEDFDDEKGDDDDDDDNYYEEGQDEPARRRQLRLRQQAFAERQFLIDHAHARRQQR